MKRAATTEENVIRIPPYKYIHVLDTNKNITSLEVGPATFVRKDHEMVVAGPLDMIRLPPRHYVIIDNPVIRDENKNLIENESGEAKVKFGDSEVRTATDYPEPFALYPYEEIRGKIEKFRVLQANVALKLRALRNFFDERTKEQRCAADEWLFMGPATYIPRVEEEVVESIDAVVIQPNEALVLRAKRDTLDSKNQKRKAGERWLVRTPGEYLPRVDEEKLEKVKAVVLTDKKALHLRAQKNFVDIYGSERKAGEEWLVTLDMADTHIRDVNEEIVGEVQITALNNRQYCVVLDPVGEDGTHRFGTKELRKGERKFFLKPGESLQSGIQQIIVLGEDEAILLKALEVYECDSQKSTEGDKKKAKFQPGEKWMIYGPCDFIPSISVEVLEKRKAIVLADNEGVYIRNNNTGEVRILKGQSYMLKAHESLWEKEVSPIVEELLALQETGQGFAPAKVDAKGNMNYVVDKPINYKRNKTKALTFKAPHNSAVQLFDFRSKKSRVVFGPDLVMLEPYEDITVLTLSGKQPKEENVIQNLALLLGPDFMTDIITVETADHAKLRLHLAYSWHFKVDKSNNDEASKIFQIKDFVGSTCKAMASRIRGAISAVTFETFHKHSVDIIHGSIFKKDASGANIPFVFNANNLIVTNVDLRSVEPTDAVTKENLQKSVTLAIDITTRSQEAQARHQSQRLEQEANSQLERQKIQDLIASEKARKGLLEKKAESASVETTGQAIAEAKAKAEAATIKGKAEVSQAKLKARAIEIANKTELDIIKSRNETETTHLEALNDLEITTERQLAQIEAEKFERIMKAIGQETLVAMAAAGPELQAKLLEGLGLKGFVIMDGKNPINLFGAASGLLGGASPAHHSSLLPGDI